MKDEIKEILDRLKDIDKTSILKNNDAKLLLDCITNLQNGFKSTIEELCETTEKFEKLQEKYERMKENAEILSKGYNDLEKRNEEAIEYIRTCNPDVDLNSMFLNESYISNYGANDLLNILQGDDTNVKD